MKIAITTFLLTFSSIAFSQSNYIEVQQEFLSERATLGAWEISTHQEKLDKSLSLSLKSHILKSGEPYAISNMNQIQALIESEKSKLYPDLKLTLNTFKSRKPLNVTIDSIAVRQGRNILRGKVDGFNRSQVKLVVYKGQMSGRITTDASKRVLVIRSIDGGISANYEVDTTDITYD